MEWALVILFGAAALLFIGSFVKAAQSSKVEQQQIEQLSFDFESKLDELKQQLRNIEIDAEITAQEAGILGIYSENRVLIREIIELHRRGYSIDSIAGKKQLNKDQVEQLLAPYRTKNERSKVANDA